jgi:ketopantoate reductase
VGAFLLQHFVPGLEIATIASRFHTLVGLMLSSQTKDATTRPRRQTEVDFLNGGIVDFGRRHGVATPGHENIWALVKGVEASWEQ